MNNSIELEMAKLLNPQFITKTAQNNNIEEAINFLVKAANILIEEGNEITADAVLEIIDSIPHSLQTRD